MTSQAADDDAVHFGKLLGSEVVDPSLCLAPGGAVVPAESVVGRFKDVVRLLVKGHPAASEGVAGGFEEGRVLPDGVEEKFPDLGVTGVGRRES